MKAPVPPNETQRLATLQRYDVLDSPPEQAFDDLALLAAHICQVPMAQVSLVAENRQWFKARIGVTATETPRDIAFCAHTILHADAVFEVHDAQADPRFASSPLVTADPHIRFYAGAPLVAPDGQALGAMCVMDRVPRTLTAEQREALRALSRHVVAQLELRRRSVDLAGLVTQHRLAEEEMAATEQEANRLLAVAEKSRRALLSILEDEKQTGQSLRESEQRFRQITENIDEVFWMTDPVKVALVYISPAYEKIWGRTCASLYQASDTWVEALYPEDRQRIMVAAKTKQLRGDYDETYRIVRPDGSVRWIHEQAFPVRNAAGEIYRMVGVAKDVTEKKLLEAQFFRAQRLESIGTLASGIAHDLNNILTPILMSAPLIRTSTSPKNTEKMLTTIESSAQRGAHLVRQLLTFGRGIEGEKRPLELTPLMTEMESIARQTFPKNITVVTTVESKLWPVFADSTQIHQVLLNLCVNARDAMPEGGQLTIQAENSTLTAGDLVSHPGAKPGGYVVLRVTDTGTGMPPEIIDKIFEPFFTTKAPDKGTGLGLATVLGLVKSHDGFLTVRSEPGAGTTFVIHLPAMMREIAPTIPVPASEAPTGHGQLILVVDDEENIRDTVSVTLTQHGYTTLVAKDGIEGAAHFAVGGKQIKLVLTDLDMPQMDGITMINLLRRIDSKARIVVSSGVASNRQMASRKEQLESLGVAAILEKPCSAAQLLKVVAEVLAS